MDLESPSLPAPLLRVFGGVSGGIKGGFFPPSEGLREFLPGVIQHAAKGRRIHMRLDIALII